MPDVRPPTDEEKKCWARLRVVLKAMPQGMEVVANATGSLSASPDGAVEKALADGGDAGAAAYILLPALSNYRVRDGSGGL
jgi:hypothetical protein